MDKKKHNAYHRLYRMDNPYKNGFHCYNSRRRKKGLSPISYEEYFEMKYNSSNLGDDGRIKKISKNKTKKLNPVRDLKGE